MTASLMLMLAATQQMLVAQANQLPQIVQLALKDGRLVEGGKSIRVKKGDAVELRVTADRPTELHLHGYDIIIRVVPGAETVMKVDAYATGRFPLSVHTRESGHPGHRHGATLLHLEVYPR